MDPITIAAGVIGIAKSISSVNSGVRWIASLRNAPAEFVDLQNELETVRGYLQTLRPILENLPNNPKAGTPRPDLTHIAEISQSLTAEVQDLVQLTEAFRAQAVRLDQNGQPRIKKIRWRRSVSTVGTHRDRVRRMRMELASAVGLLEPAQSTLILSVQQASRAEIQALQATLREATERLELSIAGRFSNNATAKGAYPSVSGSSGQVTCAAEKEAGRMTAERHEIVNTPDPSSSSPEYNPESGQVYIRLHTAPLRRCGILCLCQCHRSHSVRSNPYRLPWSVLGSFLLDYNCIPVWDPRPCNDPRCVNRADGNPSYISLVYLFPAWLFTRALHLRVSWGTLTDRGASLHISVPRVLPFDHEIFWAIDNARLDIVQSNLSSRNVFPSDISPGGSSLLFYAIARQPTTYCHSIASLLLSLTKDLNFVNYQGRSAFSHARLLVRAQADAYDPNRVELLEKIYHRGVENCEYPTGETLIHKALFRDGTDLSLGEALALDSSSVDINTFDVLGYTPLHWAGLRSDMNAVQLLIRHGADVNNNGRREFTALHKTYGPEHVQIVSMLFDNGVDINTEDDYGRTPLVRAVEEEHLGLFTSLLSRGARAVPMRLFTTTSIVHFLAHFSSPSVQIPMLKALVRQGYDLDVPNGLGRTPVFMSVWHNTAVGVRALADHGADLTLRDNRGGTLLHMAGQYATRDVFRHLEVRLSGFVNPSTLDNEGKTAMVYFRDRLPLPKEDVDAFESLVWTLRVAWEQRAVRIREVPDDETSDEEDEFFDAMETLDVAGT